MSDEAPPEATPKLPRRGGARTPPPGGKRRGYSQAARKEMAAFVVELRHTDSMMRYAEVNRRVRERFDCGHSVAERAITDAGDKLRDEFYETAKDAPRMILDGYCEIFDEAMRQGNIGQARKTLDSIRDMFGIKGATNINVNIGRGTPVVEALEQYEHLDDAQLEALAKLDILPGAKMIDVPSASDTMDDVAAAADDGGFAPESPDRR